MYNARYLSILKLKGQRTLSLIQVIEGSDTEG